MVRVTPVKEDGAGMQDSAILDDEVVTELQDVMGQDFSMLVDSFQRDGEQRLQTLASAYTAGDQETCAAKRTASRAAAAIWVRCGFSSCACSWRVWLVKASWGRFPIC